MRVDLSNAFDVVRLIIMRSSPRPLAGALAMMLMTTPSSLHADEEMAELDPGLILTGSCSDEVNLELARERGDLLMDHQLLVSCWNARHNLAEVCPEMFPNTTALLTSGPDHWFTVVFETLWKDQLTPEAVIAENRRVVTLIEEWVKASLKICEEEPQESRALRRCQRSYIKRKVE